LAQSALFADAMDINALLLTLGLPGFFSSRAFTPAFVTALVLRYGDNFPYLKNLEFLQATGSEPMWFTSNWFILAMGVLSGLELFATKSPAAEEMLGDVHKYAKTGMSFLTTMGVIGAGDVQYLGDLFQTANAGLALNAWAAIIAAITFVVTSLRNGVFYILTEADPEDDLGIRNLISWFEDTWGAFGLLFLFLYPLILLAVVGLLIGGLFGLRKYAEYREEKSRIPCASCNEPMYGSAPHCPSCDAVNPAPRAVGFLGQTKLKKPAPAPEIHQVRLASKRRCPHCATRLEKRDTHQTCPACGHAPFATQEIRDRYTRTVSARIPKTLFISYLFGLIPILGMIPGIIYYRVQLLAPYRAYMGAGQAFVLRWLLRILFLFLISAQGLLPFAAILATGPVGPFTVFLTALTVPLMALLSFTVYRMAFARKLSNTPVG
jgi:hypothetical protein